jgi:hypothetical protein
VGLRSRLRRIKCKYPTFDLFVVVRMGAAVSAESLLDANDYDEEEMDEERRRKVSVVFTCTPPSSRTPCLL